MPTPEGILKVNLFLFLKEKILEHKVWIFCFIARSYIKNSCNNILSENNVALLRMRNKTAFEILQATKILFLKQYSNNI